MLKYKILEEISKSILEELLRDLYCIKAMYASEEYTI